MKVNWFPRNKPADDETDRQHEYRPDPPPLQVAGMTAAHEDAILRRDRIAQEMGWNRVHLER